MLKRWALPENKIEFGPWGRKWRGQ